MSKSWRVGMPLASLAFRKFRRLKDGSGRSAGSTRVCVHRPCFVPLPPCPPRQNSKSLKPHKSRLISIRDRKTVWHVAS